MISVPAAQSFTAYQHKLIKELKSRIELLTEQLVESDALRREEQARFIEKEVQKPLEAVVGTERERVFQNLPFVFEVDKDNEDEIEEGEPLFLYIQDDDNRGLRVPGRGGYIKNDGPGDISYRLNNGSKNNWSHPATIKSGEIDTFDFNDNIQIVIVEITADTDKTWFRVRFTPGFVGD